MEKGWLELLDNIYVFNLKYMEKYHMTLSVSKLNQLHNITPQKTSMEPEIRHFENGN